MITEKSIDEVKEASNIVQIIGSYIDLKKQGSGYTGCCPFHDEKSPSFHVNEARGFYKCFGCGVTGSVVDFIMVKERFDFPNAIRHLAKLANITLEETAGFGEDKELQEKKADLFELNRGAAVYYAEELKNLAADHWAMLELLGNRQLTMESILLFQIGYAPDSWNFITDKMIKRGLYQAGEELGLIARKEIKTYDFFRNRIMFPIQNENGMIIGFGGRKPNDDVKENPKYLNSKTSVIYRKEAAFYGLYQAYNVIRKADVAILVEGYYDVIMMHQSGIENTVAPCGTALTETHAGKLKKLCSRVILLADGDNAGMKSMLKSVDTLVQAGLSVDICELPKGEDPDSYARQHQPKGDTDFKTELNKLMSNA